MKRALITAAMVAAIAGGLAACVTETPYQPAPQGRAAAGSFGYSDSKIDSAHWRVNFAGNSFTSRETVEKYLLYRAAELTLEQGFDWFQTTDRHTDTKTSYYSDPDPFYRSPFWSDYGWGWRPSWRYYGSFGGGFGGGGFGWRSWNPWYGDPFWADRVDIQQVQRFEASSEIVMGKGDAPSGARVFNAHEVIANLGPGVVKPKP